MMLCRWEGKYLMNWFLWITLMRMNFVIKRMKYIIKYILLRIIWRTNLGLLQDPIAIGGSFIRIQKKMKIRILNLHI